VSKYKILPDCIIGTFISSFCFYRTSSCDSVTPPLNEPVHSPPSANIQRSIDRNQSALLRQGFTNQQQVGSKDGGATSH
jgi:hypothetical protein